MNKEEALKLANECGAYEEINTPLSECIIFEKDELLAFANACKKIGMEKAAKICEEQIQEYHCDGTPRRMEYVCAEAIRAHKE